MPKVYIGIGSNLGPREENCRKAIELLGARCVSVLAESSMHETEPWGLKDQPRFINMAVSAETELSPRQLIAALKDVEAEMGRQETERYGPRIIDLDILVYEGELRDEPGLRIPHPGMHERAFVLEPLSEIAPDLVHPTLKKTVCRLKDELSAKGR